MYIQLPKPPVPLVSAREIVATFWKDEAYGEGKRAFVSRSTTKEGAPVNSSNQLADGRAISQIVEADGDGSKLTEVRFIDLAGSLMAAVVDKASKTTMPAKNFEGWTKKLYA